MVQVICPPAPAPVKEEKPDKMMMDKPDKMMMDKSGRRLSGMEEDKMMPPKDNKMVVDVPAPPPCYTIQVGAPLPAFLIIG